MVVLAIICLSWLACASNLDRGGVWSAFFCCLALGSGLVLVRAAFRPGFRGRPLPSSWRVAGLIGLPVVTLLLIWAAVPLRLRLLANRAELEAFAAATAPNERLPARVGSFTFVATEQHDGGLYLLSDHGDGDHTLGLFFRPDDRVPDRASYLEGSVHLAHGWWLVRL